MSLRTKVLLPIVLFTLVLSAYLALYWMPRSLRNLEADFRESIVRQLESVNESLVPLLLGHQLDAVYENLDTLLKKNRDWIELRVVDAKERTLYPLLPPAKAELKAKEVHIISVPIRYGEKRLGTIVLAVDFAPRLSAIKDRHWELMSVLLGGILLFAAATGFLLDRLVVRPVLQLSQASRSLAAGKFSVALEKQGDDEVGILVQDFEGMRVAIEQYRAYLQNAQKDLESELEERKAAENALRTSEEELRRSEAFIKSILENVDEGFIVIDRNFRILSANRAYLKLLKRNENVVGRYCYEVSHQSADPCFERGEVCAPSRTFTTGEPHTALHKHMGEDGKPVYTETKSYPLKDETGQVVSAIEIVIDITEKSRLEEQLRHSQKLEALGSLAGGVAHDFNNILNVIVGYASMLEMKTPPDNPAMRYIKEIMAASEKASGLTKALLIFSRKQVAELKPVNINDVISGMQTMALRLIGEDIQAQLTLSPEALNVMGDRGQLEQVLMNFVTNARDAMPHGGTLSFRTEILEIDANFVHAHGFGQPGRYALLSVSDTGCGMDEKTREKIFEPFFTTKEKGKGTGLGLSIVYGIVNQHNGFVNCYSEPGSGTVFKVYLPLLDRLSEPAEPAKAAVIPRGTETILVAEDDVTIRRLTKELLENFGYRVIEACDGSEALTAFLSQRERIHLLFFDIVMPKKSGREAYDEIRNIQPDIRVLFTSGYTEDLVHRQKIIEEKLPFIQKPAKPRELLSKIREVLDSREDRA